MLPLSQTLSQKPIYFNYMNFITSQNALELDTQWEVFAALVSPRSSIAKTTYRTLHFIWPKIFAYECVAFLRSLKYHRAMLTMVSTTNCYNSWNPTTSHNWETTIFVTIRAHASTPPPLFFHHHHCCLFFLHSSRFSLFLVSLYLFHSLYE